jgi:hypothetical protein
VSDAAMESARIGITGVLVLGRSRDRLPDSHSKCGRTYRYRLRRAPVAESNGPEQTPPLGAVDRGLPPICSDPMEVRTISELASDQFRIPRRDPESVRGQ